MDCCHNVPSKHKNGIFLTDMRGFALCVKYFSKNYLWACYFRFTVIKYVLCNEKHKNIVAIFSKWNPKKYGRHLHHQAFQRKILYLQSKFALDTKGIYVDLDVCYFNDQTLINFRMNSNLNNLYLDTYIMTKIFFE